MLTITIDERDDLVNRVNRELSEFLEQNKIPSSDARQVVREAMRDLAIDPPLKTMEEIAEMGQGCSEIGEFDPKRLIKSVADGLHEGDKTHRPAPPVTLELACDMTRLLMLKAVLKEANLKSKALENLIQEVAIMAWFLKES
ncbi:MAG: hypothetical protein KGH56_01965 [Patescibacteria group bacterium]|nr:hypothetical protein [Patescibacteria group bacterium]